MNPPPTDPIDEGAASATPERTTDELLASLRRIERLLEQLRQRLETTARAERYREFSLARLFGALLQALVVGLLMFALTDWVYQGSPAQQLVKLAFAGVLQLGALTAFLLARESR